MWLDGGREEKEVCVVRWHEGGGERGGVVVVEGEGSND